MADTTDVAQPTGEPRIAQPANPRHRSSHLNQALAWVGIVAGGLLIVAAIFFSGFFLNWSEHAHMQMGMGKTATAHESKNCCADMKPGEATAGATTPERMGPQSER